MPEIVFIPAQFDNKAESLARPVSWAWQGGLMGHKIAVCRRECEQIRKVSGASGERILGLR